MVYDITIIGAGIIGASIAYRLSKYDCSILVLEKKNDIADEVSMANSAVVHAGHDPKKNTLKAKLNVRGSRMFEKLCQDLGAAYKKTGAFLVMTEESQKPLFEELAHNAEERNIPYEVLSGEDARKEERNLSHNVIKVMSFPTTAIVTPWEVALRELQVANLNGSEVKLGTEVLSIKAKEDMFELETPKGTFESRYVINCAGLYSDRIAFMIGECEHRIIPRRGEYYVLSHNASDFVSRIIYPMPTAAGKGVLAVPTVDRNILIGPNAEFVDDRADTATTYNGLEKVYNDIGATLKDVPISETIRIFSGVRPSVAGGDFIIEKDKNHNRFLNLIGIDSPGIASAPAVAEYVEQMMELPFEVKGTYETENPFRFRFKDLSMEEKDEYIKKNPLYGQIVCRCEQVSAGEIVDCIKEPLGPTTVKGVKKRLRPGMGKCQGGFCQPYVLKLLADTLGKRPEDILYDEPGSNIVLEED